MLALRRLRKRRCQWASALRKILALIAFVFCAKSYFFSFSAQNPRVKGVRRIIQFEPDIDFCLRPDFVKGVQAVANYGLSFDI